jgi:hypothetical protein
VYNASSRYDDIEGRNCRYPLGVASDKKNRSPEAGHIFGPGRLGQLEDEDNGGSRHAVYDYYLKLSSPAVLDVISGDLR